MYRMTPKRLAEAERFAEVVFNRVRHEYRTQFQSRSQRVRGEQHRYPMVDDIEEFRHKGQCFRRLGGGVYSDVWQPEGYEYVIKVSGRNVWRNPRGEYRYDGADEDRDPWQVFAEHILHIRHKRLPRLYLYQQKSPLTAWAVMEKLYPLSSAVAREWSDHLTRCAEDYSGPTWFKFVQEINHGDCYRWDIHSGNVMQRYNGEKVLTDPFSTP